MTRKCLVAGTLAALLVAGSAAESWAQFTQTGGGTTGGTTGGTPSAGVGIGGSRLRTSQAGGGFGGGQSTLSAGYGGGLAGGLGGTSQFGLTNQSSLQSSFNSLNQRTAQLNQQQTSLQNNRTPVRIQIATAMPRPATSLSPAPGVQGTLARVVARNASAAPVAMWEGDVLVLSGPVVNESVRRQIEGVALLQPGVRSVRNDMVVGPVPVPPPAAGTIAQ